MCKPFAVLPVVLPVMRIFAAAFASLLTVSVAHAAAVADEHLEVELVGARDALVPGQTAWLGLRLKHAPQWHTYWINPGDSGLPTKLAWTLPAGYAAGGIAWPAPKRLDLGELTNFGYDGEALLPVPIKVPADAAIGTRAHLAVEAKWLVCHEECIPGKATLTLDLPVAQTAADTPYRQLFAHARASQPQPAPWPAQARLAGDRIEIAVRGTNLPDVPRDGFVVQTRVVANAPPHIEARNGELLLTFAKSDYFTALPKQFDLVLLDRNARSWLLHADSAEQATPPITPR